MHTTYPAPHVRFSDYLSWTELFEHRHIVIVSLCMCINSHVCSCTFAYTFIYQMRMFVAYSPFAFPFIKEKLSKCKTEEHGDICKNAHGVTYCMRAGFACLWPFSSASLLAVHKLTDACEDLPHISLRYRFIRLFVCKSSVHTPSLSVSLFMYALAIFKESSFFF